MADSLKKPSLITDVSAFCPGCGHGIIAKLIAEVFDEEGVADVAICAGAVGCTCMLFNTLKVDCVQSQHGRACAVGQGMKKVRPDNFVFTYQGDGDAGSIGIAETMYAAKRNANITTFFVNNGVFGMTGGQTAPTSLSGQVTVTAKNGVDYADFGKPLHMAELISTFDVGYVARGSIANIRELRKTKEYIRKAVRNQMGGNGYALVEILAPCPSNWKMDPVTCLDRIENTMMSIFKCGELKG
jgi:hypothetical protein